MNDLAKSPLYRLKSLNNLLTNNKYDGRIKKGIFNVFLNEDKLMKNIFLEQPAAE